LERGFHHTAELLEPPPDLIPQISYADLLKIQEHFKELVIKESGGLFKPDEMRVVDLTVLREVNEVSMPVPGMYGVREWAFTSRRLFLKGNHYYRGSAYNSKKII
jgi:hypothetical protein